MAAAMVGLAALTFGMLSSWHGERPNLAEASPPPPVASGAAPASPSRSPSTPAGTTPAGTTPAGTPDAPTWSPAAGEADEPCPSVRPPAEPSTPVGACARSTSLTDGVLPFGGRRFAIGEPDDEVIVGDFSCTGTPVPAVVRPGSGDVYLFSGWASAGAPVTASALTNLGPGTHLETGPVLSPRGCPSLVARSADGRPHELLTPPDPGGTP